MAKQHLLILGLILSGSALFSACNSDDSVLPGGDAGATGDAGASSDAGAPSAAGSTGDAGAIGVGGEGGGQNGEGGEGGSDEPPIWLNPQGVVVPTVGPASFKHLLVGTSDYDAKQGEVVSVTIGTGAVSASEAYADGDLIAVSSAGIGFAVERSNDKVHLLNGSDIATTFDLQDPGTDTAPVDAKAYVPLLNQSEIAILDLTENKVSRRIDLSAYNVAGDADGSAEIAEGVYDANENIVYFLLQRIDLFSYDANFHLPCSTTKALVVGIDAATDGEVDLNGAKAGKAIELSLVNPRSLSVKADGTELYLLADGCYEGAVSKHRGVEVVNLADGTTTVPYADTTLDYLASLTFVGAGKALLEASDATFVTHWYNLDVAAGTKGAELVGVPKAPTFDGTDLLGVRVTGKVGAVVRYDLTSGLSKVVSATSWAGEYSFGISTALVQ